jgi:plastocyanin
MISYFNFKSQRGSSGGEGGGGAGAFLGLLVIAGLLIFGAWYLNSGLAPIGSSTKTTSKNKSEATLIAEGKKYTIQMTAQGFAPKDLVIKRYDTLTFTNVDTKQHWPISETCPTLDSHRALNQREAYGIVFDKAQSCTFYDKTFPAFKGTIKIVN